MYPAYTPDELSIIDENTQYMLGMYDLYQNDKDIVKALKLKGLNERLITAILDRIKAPSYEKRVRQAKRMIYTGIGLLVGVFIIPALIVYFSDIHFSELEHGEGYGEGMLQYIYGFYRRFYFIFIALFVFQTIAGIMSYFKYKKLLAKMETQFQPAG